MNLNLRYSQKLLLLVLAVSLIPLIVISVILYVDRVESKTTFLKDQLVTISESNSNDLVKWIDERKNNAIVIAKDDVVISSTKKLADPKTSINERFQNRFELESKLGSSIEYFSDFENFIISNAKTGEPIFYTDTFPPDEKFKDKKHFQDAVKGETSISEVHLSTKAIHNQHGFYEYSVPTLFISTPIKGEAGIEGILTARVNFFTKPALIDHDYNFHTLDSYLVNSQGYFLSEPKYNINAVSYGLLDDPMLKLHVKNPDSNQLTEIFKLVNNKEIKYNLNGYNNYGGHFVIGAISPVGDTDWSYITEIDKSEAFHEIVTVQFLIFAIISVALLIIFVTSYYFASGLTIPINKLNDAAHEIIKGNFNVKTKINSKDEIGELANSFEYMVEYIKKTTDIEAQLALQQNLRRAIDESAIVSILDNSGHITFVNDEFCRVSKYSKEELIGKHQKILRADMYPQEFYDQLWDDLRRGEIWRGEVCNKAKDGSLFWNKTTIVPFKDKNGKIYEFVAIRYNITDQKEIALKLVQAERLTTVGELSARISHDIRNPLSVISNEIQMLKLKKLLNENQTKRIDNAIKRITHQTEEVLDYVHESPLDITKFNLTELVKESLDTMMIPSNVKITISENEVFMAGDKHKMEVVLINLIYNAIQVLEEEGGTIDIKLVNTKSEIIIEVIDSGSGIKLEPIEKVFEPMVTTKQKGTGLGLVSVKSIVEMHNGSITVKNNPTAFTIKIPKTADYDLD